MKDFFIIVILVVVSVVCGVLTKGKPSLWGDEVFGGVQFLGAESLGDFLLVLWSIGPEVAPLYPSSLYLWNRIFPHRVEYYRYLSFGIGIAGIMGVYLLCRKFSTQRVALWTALSIMLLPIHQWYSWLLRPHIFAYTLCVVSVMLFWVWLSCPNRLWLCLLIATNVLLICTHYIFLWLLLAEAGYVWLFSKLNRLQKWLLIGGMVCLSGVLCVYLVFFVQANNLGFESENDVIKLSMSLFGFLDFEVPAYSSWAVYLPGWLFSHGWITPRLNSLLSQLPRIIQMAGNILLMVGVMYVVINRIRRYFICQVRSFEPPDFFIFVSIIFPTFMAIVQLMTGLSVYMPRYFYIALVGKVFLIYLALSSMQNVMVRKFLTALVLIYFIHQYMLYRANQPYTDWKGCVEYLSTHVQSQDMIVAGRLEEALVLRANWQDCPVSIGYSPSFHSIFEGLKNNYPHIIPLDRAIPSAPDNIWVVSSMQWNNELPCIYRDEFSRRGIGVQEEKIFPAFEGLVCYKVPFESIRNRNVRAESANSTLWDNSYSCASTLQWEFDKQRQRVERMQDVGLTNGLQTEDEYFFQFLLFPEGTAGMSTIPLLSFYLLDQHKGDWANLLIDRFASRIVWASLSGLLMELDQGNRTGAYEKLLLIRKQNIFLYFLIKPYYHALSRNISRQRYDEAMRLRKMGFPLGWFLSHRYRLD